MENDVETGIMLPKLWTYTAFVLGRHREPEAMRQVLKLQLPVRLWGMGPRLYFKDVLTLCFDVPVS